MQPDIWIPIAINTCLNILAFIAYRLIGGSDKEKEEFKKQIRELKEEIEKIKENQHKDQLSNKDISHKAEMAMQILIDFKESCRNDD